MCGLFKATKEIIGEARTCVRALQESRYHTKQLTFLYMLKDALERGLDT